MRDRIRRALEWCGFTPTQREAFLRRELGKAMDVGAEQRAAVQRVERLLHFREGLGAGVIETPAIRAAIYGEDRDR